MAPPPGLDALDRERCVRRLEHATPSGAEATPGSSTTHPPLGSLLDLVGRGLVALPAFENHAGAKGKITAVVVQHLEDEIEDGHEVMFQTEAPRHECRCFLEGLAKGAPAPRAPGVALALGDPVFFRHAKAGELAEHFQRYLLVRGAAIEAQIDTHRGAGQCSH